MTWGTRDLKKFGRLWVRWYVKIKDDLSQKYRKAFICFLPGGFRAPNRRGKR